MIHPLFLAQQPFIQKARAQARHQSLQFFMPQLQAARQRMLQAFTQHIERLRHACHQLLRAWQPACEASDALLMAI